MNTQVAIEILETLHKNNSLWDSEIEAIKTILKEYKTLIKEVSKLALDSIQREMQLARLEAEVIYLSKYKSIHDDLSK